MPSHELLLAAQNVEIRKHIGISALGRRGLGGTLARARGGRRCSPQASLLTLPRGGRHGGCGLTLL